MPEMGASLKDAQECLDHFIEKAGSVYETKRNYDYGPDQHRWVSQLSKYLSRRIILPEEVIHQVQRHHGIKASAKFCQEVYWQSYWRGWLCMRPQVWLDAQKFDDSYNEKAAKEAIAGRTGIDAFDAWVKELKDTGYLHNHARMWFASIWIHTLRLDWKLGADFFRQHLIDFDPASNTLGWRWVAGIQTKGKAYIATEENIKKFTQGRFQAQGLAETPAELIDHVSTDISRPVKELPGLQQSDNDASAWILFPDDYSVHRSIALSAKTVAIVDPLLLDPSTQGTAREFSNTAREHLVKILPQAIVLKKKTEITSWFKTHGGDTIRLVAPSTGPCEDLAMKVLGELKSNHRVKPMRRSWDQHLFPLAKKGFFAFKKSIGLP